MRLVKSFQENTSMSVDCFFYDTENNTPEFNENPLLSGIHICHGLINNICTLDQYGNIRNVPMFLKVEQEEPDRDRGPQIPDDYQGYFPVKNKNM